MIDGDGGLSRKLRDIASDIEPTRIGCDENATMPWFNGKANSAPVFTGREPIGPADEESAGRDVGLGAWRPLLLAATVVDIPGVRPALLSQPRRFRLDALATM
jgi:hypothetical protein